jgi:hypothetical protein
MADHAGPVGKLLIVPAALTSSQPAKSLAGGTGGIHGRTRTVNVLDGAPTAMAVAAKPFNMSWRSSFMGWFPSWLSCRPMPSESRRGAAVTLGFAGRIG